jgi:nicotinamidase-related amidase
MSTARTLLVIDAQIGIDTPAWGERSQPDAAHNIARLLATWRSAEWPVIHVQHDSTNPASPLFPGKPSHDFMPEAKPLDSEPVFNKQVNSAFIGTTLEQYLRDRAMTSLVIAGFTADHCISTTVRMAGNLGFDVVLAADATATHERHDIHGTHFGAELMHATTLASLHDEFAQVQTTDAILAGIRA